MRVALIYPPLSDPRAPQLALPSLAATLRRNGIETELHDFNLTGILAVLEPAALEGAAQRILARSKETARARMLARNLEQLAPRIGSGLGVLRDPERFFDPHAFNAARDTMLLGLELASAGSQHPVACSILPVRYDVAGCRPSRLEDLVRATEDGRANLFLEAWSADQVPRLEQGRPDLIGITLTNRQQILPGLMLARLLRRRGHFVVLGGAVLSKFAGQLRERPAFFEYFADGVVLYEGDTALLALVTELAGPRDWSRVPNFLYLEGGAVRKTLTHVERVNELPTPDFEGLPLDDYLAPHRVLPILAGKGCYFNRCKFCDIPYINHVAKPSYRLRTPQQIAEDVRSLRDRFGSRHFIFTDEALPPALLTRIAGAFDEARIEDCHFTGYARLERGFSRDVCDRLAAMGMRKLFFGLESGDQATLDHMDKGIRVAEAPGILRNCQDAGIAYHVFSIIGFPEEQEESARATFGFFRGNRDLFEGPANSFDIHPFGLELRTAYFEKAESLGVQFTLDPTEEDFLIGLEAADWINARGLSPEEVHRLIEGEFYPALRTLYRTYHNCPVQFWPAFEEYAVLYGDHYRSRPFPYRTTIADGQSYGAAPVPTWSASIIIERQANGIRLLNPYTSRRVSGKIFRRFSTRPHAAGPVRPSVSSTGQNIDPERLIGEGLLVIPSEVP